MRVTLQTFHYASGAEKLMESSDAALKVERYHRPGAPFAGIMMSANIQGSWVRVGWIPEKFKKLVMESCGGRPERLRVTLADIYVKRGYYVVKVKLESYY
ncbi:hypothetical protein Bbelb_421370 [Branchiostoma belcheri]|nr:hypothetical protein Bbelb_421370 [Branchiostoma belcheri]